MRQDALVHCRQCGAILDEPHDLNEGLRKPCPNCGSVDRRLSHPFSMKGVATIHTSLRMRVTNPNVKRPTSESLVGDSYSHKLGKWMRIRRMIDRVRNWYSETVIDPASGEVIHKTEEQLSEHVGHGSAKKK
jgi:hypothetical protein